ncbi:MAG: 2-amino-4-hydroxy-6-hydroxymethyldihydropteridine diphosphokinase [Planctomycetota bacterium]
MTRALVALGSNLGDRARTIEAACEAICRLPGTCVVARSTLRETAPVGGPEQGPFLNGAAEVETRLPARELLEGLLAIERELGRIRRELNGPRTIDLDLILFGDAVVSEAGLELPHPRFRERRFVLEPLAEVAPDARDPVTGRSIAQLLAELEPVKPA